MRIFLSYPAQYRREVEPISLALCAQGHDVFFDRDDLEPGEEYDNRIRSAIEDADLLVFMLSPDAIDAGSYTLNELGIAQKTWPLPGGRVLPVMLRPVPVDQVPPYLEAVTVLLPEGNLTAAVADTVYRIARRRRRKLYAKAVGALGVAAVAALGAYGWWVGRGPEAERIGRDGAPAVLIPAGAFTMGDDENAPRRDIYLNSYYIDKYEVTTARYAKFLEVTGSVGAPEEWQEPGPKRSGELPVVGVAWEDARDYCRWAGRRLPTEAEWEKAARGADARAYPWGNDPPIEARARYARDAPGPYDGGLAPAGRHESGASPYGVHDLAGNASEWVSDWHSESFSRGEVRNPKGPARGRAKIIRGGGWHDPVERIAATKRYFANPETRGDDVGFRCAGNARK